MAKALLAQGANMVWLGGREPELYGATTAAELDALMRGRAAALGIFYANAEGEAVARIYAAAKDGVDGLLMNPAGFPYAGHAFRDCIRAVLLPYVEVHMTNIERRGARSVPAAAANGVICALGISSYLRGLDARIDLIEAE